MLTQAAPNQSFQLSRRPKDITTTRTRTRRKKNNPNSETQNSHLVVLNSLCFKAVMDTLAEDQEEYGWREVVLPVLIPIVPETEPELERETGERRRGRDILIAVDHGPKSKHAFDWALIHLCRLADTIHLIHVVSSVKNEVIYEASQRLMEKLAVDAFEVAMVRTVARIVEGDPGKVICKEAERLKPAAVVMGTRGRGIVQSVLQGSVGEYCFHHCKSAPIIIVPRKEDGDEALI